VELTGNIYISNNNNNNNTYFYNNSMETNMGDSVYNSFTRSSDPIGYYPPNSSQDDSQSLRQGDGTNNDNF